MGIKKLDLNLSPCLAVLVTPDDLQLAVFSQLVVRKMLSGVIVVRLSPGVILKPWHLFERALADHLMLVTYANGTLKLDKPKRVDHSLAQDREQGFCSVELEVAAVTRMERIDLVVSLPVEGGDQ